MVTNPAEMLAMMRKVRDCPTQAKVSKLARIMIVDKTCHQLSKTLSWVYFFVA